MKNQKKTKKQLPEDIEILHQRIRELEKEVKASEQQYGHLATLIADNIPGYVAYVGMNDLRYRFVNDRFEQSFGIPRKKIIGSHIREIIGEDNYTFAKKYLAVVRSGKATSYENTFNIAEGKRWVKVNYVPDFDNDGKVTGVIVLSYDITERKRLDKALKESERRYRLIFEQAPFGIGLISFDGKILKANPIMETISGYTIDELQNLDVSNLYADPEEREKVLADIRKHGGVTDRQILFKRKDGTLFDGSITTKIVGIDGTDVLHTLVQDVSERIKMEVELQKSQKLESIGLLAGGIAHDFNNMLGGLFGYIDMALEHSSGDPKLAYYLERAMTAYAIAKDLTGQLLTFSKGGGPDKNVVSVPAIIQETEHMALSGSNIRCEYTMAKALRLIEADTGQLSQVFTNILLNSRQAMPDGGTITIKCSNRKLENNRITDLSEGQYVQIVIKDTGLGIPQELLPKVFDPFFTTKQLGSGLGLATSYSIIRKHDGNIAIDSEPGVGTAITILLPATDAGLSKEQVKRIPVLTGTGRILIMDDDKMVRRATGEQLKNLGYSFEQAGNGEEAIKLYRMSIRKKKKFDAVILDLTVVGGMGGEEAIKKLLQIDPEVKGVVSSGYSNDPVLADPEEYGFVAKITKPYLKSELAGALNEAIGGKGK